jgi:AP-1 complex subunit beta-1
VCARLQLSNIFTVARRNVDGREMLYHSVKFTNGVWLLAELNLPGVNEPSGNAITVRIVHMQPRVTDRSATCLQLSLKSRNTVVLEDSKAIIEAILKA